VTTAKATPRRMAGTKRPSAQLTCGDDGLRMPGQGGVAADGKMSKVPADDSGMESGRIEMMPKDGMLRGPQKWGWTFVRENVCGSSRRKKDQGGEMPPTVDGAETGRNPRSLVS